MSSDTLSEDGDALEPLALTRPDGSTLTLQTTEDDGKFLRLTIRGRGEGVESDILSRSDATALTLWLITRLRHAELPKAAVSMLAATLLDDADRSPEKRLEQGLDVAIALRGLLDAFDVPSPDHQ